MSNETNGTFQKDEKCDVKNDPKGQHSHINIGHDLRFIFHWGIYSVPAFDDPKSARRRKLQNGSEWYLKRLMNVSFRPPSGTKETIAYHEQQHPGKSYESFVDDWKAEAWNVDSWMKLAKKAGATYVILTSRHHDGFCLWNSEYSDFGVKTGGPKCDIVQKFKEAAHKARLSWGVYYSWFDWNNSVTKKYLLEVVENQVNELLRYEPEIWFFDGHWELKNKQYADKIITNLCKQIKKETPNALINDRITNKSYSDYRVWNDRYIPEETPSIPWVHINTIGMSWGYNKAQEISDYKSSRDVTELISKIRKLRGGILLNLGPKSDGTLDEYEEKTVLELRKE